MQTAFWTDGHVAKQRRTGSPTGSSASAVATPSDLEAALHSEAARCLVRWLLLNLGLKPDRTKCQRQHFTFLGFRKAAIARFGSKATTAANLANLAAALKSRLTQHALQHLVTSFLQCPAFEPQDVPHDLLGAARVLSALSRYPEQRARSSQ